MYKYVINPQVNKELPDLERIQYAGIIMEGKR